MNPLNQALRTLSVFLSKDRIPYMVIGGLANAIWGNPRSTIDIDVTIWIEDTDIEKTIANFQSKFTPLVDAPHEFVVKTRVLPIATKDNVRIDVIFGGLPFEHDAIIRAVNIDVAGVAVKFCTPEDLILLKIISKRQKDLDDVKGIVRNQMEKLDLSYLEPRIEELSTLLERPEILIFWQDSKNIL